MPTQPSHDSGAPNTAPQPAPARVSIAGAAKVAAVVLAVAAIVVGGRTFAGRLLDLLAWVDGLGAWGPLAFVAVYVAAVAVLLPASILTLAAGALFGLAHGVLYAFVAASIGGTVAFLLARTILRGWVERRTARDPRVAAIDRAIAAEGRKIVFLLRLSPAIPFNVLNTALGVTKVRLADYVAGFPGMLPATALYVYYGKVAGDLATLAAGGGVRHDSGYYVVLGLGLVATLVATAFVTRLARRALAAAA